MQKHTSGRDLCLAGGSWVWRPFAGGQEDLRNVGLQTLAAQCCEACESMWFTEWRSVHDALPNEKL